MLLAGDFLTTICALAMLEKAADAEADRESGPSSFRGVVNSPLRSSASFSFYSSFIACSRCDGGDGERFLPLR